MRPASFRPARRGWCCRGQSAPASPRRRVPGWVRQTLRLPQGQQKRPRLPEPLSVTSSVLSFLFVNSLGPSIYAIEIGGQKTTGWRKIYWESRTSDKNPRLVCRVALILGAAVSFSRSERFCLSPRFRSLFGGWTSRRNTLLVPGLFSFSLADSIEKGVLAGYSCGPDIPDSFGVFALSRVRPGKKGPTRLWGDTAPTQRLWESL